MLCKIVSQNFAARTRPFCLILFSLYFVVKDCPTDVIEPKQKRKLAYCVNKDKAPDCILLDVVVNRKKPVKVLFKQEKNNSWSGINPSSFPVDVLL